VVLTGGPGAGKTAVLEVIRRHFCSHVKVLPEAASILFSGGFPRRRTDAGRRGAQRAIFHVQRELERSALEEGDAAIVLCDRGTVDGLAYWPDGPATFWSDVGSNHAEELARYACVLHLRTPADGNGYDHSNPVRIENAHEAAQIDARILDAWRAHPHRHLVESTNDFIEKVRASLDLLRHELPMCCRLERPEVEESRT
jgi:hypothetical protein